MQRLTDMQWMWNLPHHIKLVGLNEEASEWCLDNLYPRDWHFLITKEIKGFRRTIPHLEIYAFRHKKDALMFKLMWWNI